VAKVHLEAIHFAQRHYTIILIGHAGHDEVLGTLGQAPSIRLIGQQALQQLGVGQGVMRTPASPAGGSLPVAAS
jgi:4-hydroxy-3-methylbut-2-enyl diphosphate reductase IspH